MAPTSTQETKVPINAAETPAIKRNSEMRSKGNRRSSLGLRGKRVSAAINGLCRILLSLEYRFDPSPSTATLEHSCRQLSSSFRFGTI